MSKLLQTIGRGVPAEPYGNFERVDVTEPMQTPSPRLTARLSWILPLVAIGLSLTSTQVMNADGTSTTLAVVLGGIGVLLAAAGMLLALFSFTGIPTHGPKGVVVPAICGVVLCSIYLGLFMLTLARASQAAMEADRSQQPAAANTNRAE